MTGNLLIAPFQHFLSREGDPDLHTHFTILNVTYDHHEQCYKALQAEPIYRVQRLVTEVYRQRLRAQLHSLGYTTRETPYGF